MRAKFFPCGAHAARPHMHAYMHIYTHTYIHAYIHTYIHTYIHIYIHTYIHAYIHTHIHTCTHAYVHDPNPAPAISAGARAESARVRVCAEPFAISAFGVLDDGARLCVARAARCARVRVGGATAAHAEPAEDRSGREEQPAKVARGMWVCGGAGGGLRCVA